MSESGRNQAVIGAFIVGAVALVVLGVVVFGSGKVFRETDRFVTYFEGSVKGLNIGAPVTFRGVRIGSVVDITLRANPKTLNFSIPVVIEVEKNKIERDVETAAPADETVKRLIQRGLRAKLDWQSIVTGQLLINLELLPEEPLRLSGLKHRFIEIPTVPTTFERLAKTFEDVPIDQIVDSISSTTKALEAIVRNPELPKTIERLGQASANLEALTSTLNQRAVPVLDSLQKSIQNASQLMRNANAQMQPLAEDAGKVMANVAQLTDANAKERHELRTMLNELSQAARSIRVWSNYLERHPEALIRGKGDSKRR